MSQNLSESKADVLKNALTVASACLKAQGIEFVEAATLELAHANDALFSKHISENNNIVYAAAVWMQNHRFFHDEEIGDVATKVAGFIFKQAEDCFYDQGDIEIALALYQLAAGLDPANEKILYAVIAPCVQGNKLYPEIALSYAICVVALNPERDEVVYIEGLIASNLVGSD